MFPGNGIGNMSTTCVFFVRIFHYALCYWAVGNQRRGIGEDLIASMRRSPWTPALMHALASQTRFGCSKILLVALRFHLEVWTHNNALSRLI